MVLLPDHGYRSGLGQSGLAALQSCAAYRCRANGLRSACRLGKALRAGRNQARAYLANDSTPGCPTPSRNCFCNDGREHRAGRCHNHPLRRVGRLALPFLALESQSRPPQSPGDLGKDESAGIMTFLEPVVSKPGVEDRAAIARERAQTARGLLASCHFCAHHCGVNRLAGERGLCHAGAETRCFSAQVEVSDELEIIPTFAVALGGCDLRCDFCITGASSWNAAAGTGFEVRATATQAKQALEAGARTVMLLGGEPTIHLPAALEFVAGMPAAAGLVWKTNAHGSAEARALLEGM